MYQCSVSSSLLSVHARRLVSVSVTVSVVLCEAVAVAVVALLCVLHTIHFTVTPHSHHCRISVLSYPMADVGRERETRRPLAAGLAGPMVDSMGQLFAPTAQTEW